MKKIFQLIFLFVSYFSFSFTDQVDYWKAQEYHENSSSQKNAASDLLSHLVFHDHYSILDVGCGDGKITAELADKVPCGSVLGIDISPQMIDFAHATFPDFKFPNLKFLLKDAQTLDFDNEFDLIVSFTTLQWLQNHNFFLKNAHRSLKQGGTIAITMPTGLPHTLQQSVNETISSPEWAHYFENFIPDWNFTNEIEYTKLLSINHFTISFCRTILQKDIFPSRESFEKFVSQWLVYLRPLPAGLKHDFLIKVIDRFIELEPLTDEGKIHFNIYRLDVIATK